MNDEGTRTPRPSTGLRVRPLADGPTRKWTSTSRPSTGSYGPVLPQQLDNLLSLLGRLKAERLEGNLKGVVDIYVFTYYQSINTYLHK